MRAPPGAGTNDLMIIGVPPASDHISRLVSTLSASIAFQGTFSANRRPYNHDFPDFLIPLGQGVMKLGGLGI